MPRHIVNLLVLMSVVLLGAVAAKAWFTDPSFYRYGHYRADAVPELAQGMPLYRGGAWCLSCHADGQTAWAAGSHKTVECEVCHGAVRDHPDHARHPVPADTIPLCTTCHLAMPARPSRQPQIVLGDHPFPGDEALPCQDCHDPHSPGDGGQAAEASGAEGLPDSLGTRVANAPAAAAKCGKCHGQLGEGVRKNPPLAGLGAADFVERMNLYRTGEREHRMMNKLARTLSETEIEQLAGYYESLPGERPE